MNLSIQVFTNVAEGVEVSNVANCSKLKGTVQIIEAAFETTLSIEGTFSASFSVSNLGNFLGNVEVNLPRVEVIKIASVEGKGAVRIVSILLVVLVAKAIIEDKERIEEVQNVVHPVRININRARGSEPATVPCVTVPKRGGVEPYVGGGVPVEVFELHWNFEASILGALVLTANSNFL